MDVQILKHAATLKVPATTADVEFSLFGLLDDPNGNRGGTGREL